MGDMYIEELKGGGVDCGKEEEQLSGCGAFRVGFVAEDARRALVGAGARVLFYPTLLYNILRNKVQAEFRWWDRVDEFVLLGAVPFPSDVLRTKELGVGGVVTLNEPYETLVPTSLYHEIQEDISTNHSTLILHARSLVPSSGGDGKCWAFISEKTSGGENIEVAELKKTKGQLNVRGDVSMANLTTGVEYEVVLMVRLKKGGCGWEHPVTVILSVPGEGDKRRRVNLYEKPRDEWFDLKVGDFKAKAAGTGQLCSFLLLQEGEHEKKGLLLQSAVVKPKSPYHTLYGLA